MEKRSAVCTPTQQPHPPTCSALLPPPSPSPLRRPPTNHVTSLSSPLPSPVSLSLVFATRSLCLPHVRVSVSSLLILPQPHVFSPVPPSSTIWETISEQRRLVTHPRSRTKAKDKERTIRQAVSHWLAARPLPHQTLMSFNSIVFLRFLPNHVIKSPLATAVITPINSW